VCVTVASAGRKRPIRGLCLLVLDEIHGVGVEGASRLSGLSFR
jgi:hypothetical protein